MKVLLTTHQFLPEFSAGTEVLTLSVAKELHRRGHDVRVLTGFPDSADLGDEQRFDEYWYGEIRVHRFHHAYVPMGGQTSLIEINFDNRLAAQYFGRLLDEFAPDAVHFFHFSRLGTGLIDECESRNIPACFTPTDFWVLCTTAQLRLEDGRLCTGPSLFGGNCIKHLVETQSEKLKRIISFFPIRSLDILARATSAKLLPNYPHSKEIIAVSGRLATNVKRLNRLRRILAPTKQMRDLLVQHGVEPTLITQSSYGIDIPPFAERYSPRDTSPTFRIGFIGTLAMHKGCHILIDAFKRLTVGRAILQIYGNTQDFPDYVKQLKLAAESATGIEFKGTFPNSEIGKVLAGLDVLVVPSLWYENTPLVLHSAAAARCPVIASDLPGISEVLHNEENGLLFEKGNDEALSRCLQRMMNDPELSETFRRNCHAPKSSVQYVDELINAWKDARDELH